MAKNWADRVVDYCLQYNIPLDYLADTLYEPKVIPMIRGKAFEFSVFLALKGILNSDEWELTKPSMNAQTGFHDIDVRILHKKMKKALRVECKLAKKGSYKLFSDGHSEIRVKCMRSRTLGPAKIRELAPKWGVSEKLLKIHNDQYLSKDFDLVVSSIGNAFYQTDKKTGLFVWKPTEAEQKFLLKLGASNSENLRDSAFKKLYVAKAKDLVVSPNSGVSCGRRKCNNKRNCGFIPNYPIIYFDAKTNKPANAWIPIEESLNLLRSFLSN